ncbi:helix-turn-helix transcriptional regulator [Nocardioides silvaticus]|nr:helix-turn-helix transcriptional regulator [Nocardioides silvaticus]
MSRALPWVAGTVGLTLLLLTVTISSDPGLWKQVLVALVLGVPGGLSAAQHPRNTVGWLLLAVSLLFALSAFTSQWVETGHGSGAAWAVWFTDRPSAALVPLTLLALVLLPDGRLPSPVWRPLLATVLGMQGLMILVWCLLDGPAANPDSDWQVDPDNPVGVLPHSWEEPLAVVDDWVLQVPFVLVLVALAVRLRQPEAREQMRMLLLATAAFVLLVVLGHALWPAAADVLDLLGAVLLGVGFGATLLRTPPPETEDGSILEDGTLSTREREVLELVAEGLTNKEIADRLFISPITARNHVSRILGKLELENRTQAATWLNRRKADQRLRGP